MSSRILIVDSVAANRIILKVKLQSARFTVDTARSLTEASEAIVSFKPEFVIFSADAFDAASIGALIALTPGNDATWIGVNGPACPEARLALLTAGVRDVLPAPLSETFLFARLRRLLRAKDVLAELDICDDTLQVFDWDHDLAADCDAHTLTLTGPSHSFTERDTSSADVIILDARSAGFSESALFSVIAQHRQSIGSDGPLVLVLLEGDELETAAMAYDLGASDVALGAITQDEISLRANRLAQTKQKQALRRNQLKHGLESAFVDPLTGLYNRRYAEPVLAKFAHEFGNNYAIMVIDLDHFKQINDTYGHIAGDRVLVQVSTLITRHLRRGDFAARFGGEEFLLALPQSDEHDAHLIAERIRTAIAESGFAVGPHATDIQVTSSIGIAVSQAGDGHEQTIRRADDALYAAKGAGRNRIKYHRCIAA